MHVSTHAGFFSNLVTPSYGAVLSRLLQEHLIELLVGSLTTLRQWDGTIGRNTCSLPRGSAKQSDNFSTFLDVEKVSSFFDSVDFCLRFRQVGCRR